MGVGRSGLRALLASSSAAALLIGGSIPAAAACKVTETNKTVATASNSSPTGNCILINHSTVTGNVINTSTGILNGAGTPAGTGIIVNNNSTVGGSVSNAGRINAPSSGIVVDSAAVSSISNSGTISVSSNDGNGIRVSSVALFGTTSAGGGIANSGTISGGNTGIRVRGISTFAGGISNGGTIAAGYAGINLTTRSTAAVDTFAGGISNSGMISASIGMLLTVTTFAGSINNSGTISGSGGNAAITVVAVQFGTTSAGGITNSGLISASNNAGIHVTESKFIGNISNSGTIQGRFLGIATSASTFSGSVVNGNTGLISGGTGAGIAIGAEGYNLYSSSLFGIATAGGGVVNNGTITGDSAGIAAGVGTFLGGITNTGTISGGIRVGVSTDNGIGATISTFLGGIVNSGTITATPGNVGTFRATPGNGIWVGGALNYSSVTISTFGGGIANNGNITAAGKGIIVGGVLATDSSLTISTFSGGISNAGIIVAQTGIAVDSHVLTFQGVIANSGTITGTGGTAIDLSSAPNGITVDITGGVISGNIAGSGTGNGDTVNFSPSGSFAYSDTISGMQAVNINSGTLFDGGAITAAGVLVNAGSTLAPGTPGLAGTVLRVTGSLAFASGAYYLDTIGGGTASKTTVAGSTTLAGASVQVANGSTVTVGTRYTILTDTAGDLGGGNIFSPNVVYDGYRGLLSYNPDDVYLTFVLNNLLALLPPGAPANVVAIANSIDNDTNGTLPAGFINLFNLSGAQLEAALTRLDGEDATGAQIGAFTLMTEFLELLSGGDGSGGNTNGGLGFAPDQQTELPPDIALAYDAILKAPAKQTFDQRWSAWAAGFGGTSITDGNAAVGSNTVTTTTYGSAAGMEYRPDPNTRLGFALAGAGLNWALAQGLGTGRSDAFLAGVYGKSSLGPVYLSAALAFGNNWFTTDRTAAFGDQLTASFTGQSYAARGEAGYRYTLTPSLPSPAGLGGLGRGLIGVAPYAALQTQWFHTPAYNETDVSGGGFALAYNANTANDTRSELGARFDDLTAWNTNPLMLRASLAWAHDWTSGTGLNAAFETLPGSAFAVNGAAVPPNSALTSASAQYFFTPALSFTAKFDGEFAPTAQTYATSGTLRFTW